MASYCSSTREDLYSRFLLLAAALREIRPGIYLGCFLLVAGHKNSSLLGSSKPNLKSEDSCQSSAGGFHTLMSRSHFCGFNFEPQKMSCQVWPGSRLLCSMDLCKGLYSSEFELIQFVDATDSNGP